MVRKLKWGRHRQTQKAWWVHKHTSIHFKEGKWAEKVRWKTEAVEKGDEKRQRREEAVDRVGWRSRRKWSREGE
jgi:hypothetical protein